MPLIMIISFIKIELNATKIVFMSYTGLQKLNKSYFW